MTFTQKLAHNTIDVVRVVAGEGRVADDRGDAVRGEGRVHQDDLADIAGGEDVPDVVARDDDGDVAGDAVVEADVGDGGDPRLAVDVADRARDGEPAVEPACVVDEAADGAEPRVLVGLRRLVVEGELLEGVARMSSARESPQFAEMYLNGVTRTTLATEPSVSPARMTSCSEVRREQTSLCSTNVSSSVSSGVCAMLPACEDRGKMCAQTRDVSEPSCPSKSARRWSPRHRSS